MSSAKWRPFCLGLNVLTKALSIATWWFMYRHALDLMSSNCSADKNVYMDIDQVCC